MRMTIKESIYYSLYDPSNLKFLAERTSYFTNEQKMQERFGDTGSWLKSCRDESVAYQALSDYCY